MASRKHGYTALFAVLFTESFGFLLSGETFLIGATLLAMKGQFDIIVVAGWAILALFWAVTSAASTDAIETGVQFLPC